MGRMGRMGVKFFEPPSSSFQGDSTFLTKPLSCPKREDVTALSAVFLKSSRPSLPLKKAPPLISASPLREEEENRPIVLYLPHLSLPSGRVLNPLPSPRPFQKGKGCNRPPVLGTTSLYGCRTIKGLRHVVRAGTAWE